jgi:serine O-acetyltransferase
MLNRWTSTFKTDLPLNPSWGARTTLAVWRFGQAAETEPGITGTIARKIHTALDILWIQIAVGAELPRSVHAGERIRLPHAGRGIILHPATVVGSDVTIYHGVTVGVRGSSGAPEIADRAYLGAKATVLGDVRVGTDAKVGAHAVVIRSVPDGMTAVGVPAHLTRPIDDSRGRDL